MPTQPPKTHLSPNSRFIIPYQPKSHLIFTKISRHPSPLPEFQSCLRSHHTRQTHFSHHILESQKSPFDRADPGSVPQTLDHHHYGSSPAGKTLTTNSRNQREFHQSSYRPTIKTLHEQKITQFSVWAIFETELWVFYKRFEADQCVVVLDPVLEFEDYQAGFSEEYLPDFAVWEV